MSQFRDFLDQLAIALQFNQLSPDAQGACLLITKQESVPLLFEFDDRIVSSSILLSSPISPIHPNYRTTLFQACLKGNQQIEETFSKKPDEEQIYLHRRIHPKIEASDLKVLVEQFINRVTSWKLCLENLQESTPCP